MTSRRRHLIKVAAEKERAALVEAEDARLRNEFVHRVDPIPPRPRDGINEFGSEEDIREFRQRLQSVKDHVQRPRTWADDAVEAAKAVAGASATAFFVGYTKHKHPPDVDQFKRDMRLAKDRWRAARAAESSFRLISLLLPKRIRDEEIGDALEDVARLLRDPRCPNIYRAVRWKIISTWFWLLWHAVGRIGSAIRGRKAE